MTKDKSLEKNRRLILLMRRIVREEAWQVMDEHVTDYEHKAKPSEELELG